MTAPLAHLYALALRALDAHERRRHELRARLAPVLAAGAAGIALLAGPAASAAAAGSSPAAAALVATAGAAVVTLAAVGRLACGSAARPAFNEMLCGILVVLCGLALTALVG
jgi:hypothetical protein